MGDVFKTCDLECQGKNIDKLGNRHEFVGPVKIVLVESTPADYKRKIWFSALFTFIMLLLGATVFTVFFFTLNFRIPFKMNIHVLLCTMGFQLFMTTGIMMFSTLFGGSMVLKPGEKKFQHFFLELCAVVFGLVGSLFALGNMSTSVHALSGFAGTILTIVTCLVGPTVYTKDPEKLFGLFNRRSHRNIAIPAYLLVTVCFALGLLKTSFIKWLPCAHLNFILIGFTFIYSLTAVLCVVDRLVNGFVAVSSAVAAMFVGPIVYITNPYNCFGKFVKNIHRLFAVPAFVSSNLCFVLGLVEESFIKWQPYENMYKLLIFFCFVYSVSAFTSMILRSKYHI